MTTDTAEAEQFTRHESANQTVHAHLALWMFIGGVVVCGTVSLASAVTALPTAPLNLWILPLVILTMASSRYSIKVPGHPATVSVSEVFVFTSILLFGPAPATLTVAADGLWISLTQKNQRVYRTLFNVAEPAMTTFAAATVFFALADLAPSTHLADAPVSMMLPALVMTITYFVLNSVLQAAAVALENDRSVFDVWAQHALFLGLNYYAAASLATLAVNHVSGLNLEVIGLVAPLPLLSYAAYKAAANRVEDAHRHVAEVEHLYKATVETLAIAVDAKDQVTHGHIRRVQRHTVALARALGVTDAVELKALEAASLLHDVGKLAVPDYVLNKPGALSPSEFERIKLHAAKGAEILTTVEFPYPVVPIVRHHHEQWNGSGYPDGLSGESIPLGARILTVVDCFDAVTSDRPYRRKLTDEAAISILLSRRGTMYDPAVVDAFIELVPALRRNDRYLESGVEHGKGVSDAEARQSALPRPAAFETGAAHSPFFTFVGATLTTRIGSGMPAAEACLFAMPGEGGRDELAVAHATPILADVVASLRIPLGEGIAGWVAANRHTIVNSNPDLDLGDLAFGLGLHACTATPVFALGQLVGVLAVYLPQPRGFTDDDVRWIGALAQEIALDVARCGGAVIPGRPAARHATVC